MADGQAAAIHIPKESDNVTTDKAHSPPSLVLEQTKEKQMGKLGGPSSPDDAQETNSLSETHRTSDEVAQPDSEDRGDFNSSHSELSGQDNADISQNPALKEGQSKGEQPIYRTLAKVDCMQTTLLLERVSAILWLSENE